MYKVTRVDTTTNPRDTFSISYVVDSDGDNHEWRSCADNILLRLSKSHAIIPINVPEFQPLEDFVELTYKVDEHVMVLSSDFLLDTIYVATNNIEFTQKLCLELGSQVGWE